MGTVFDFITDMEADGFRVCNKFVYDDNTSLSFKHDDFILGVSVLFNDKCEGDEHFIYLDTEYCTEKYDISSMSRTHIVSNITKYISILRKIRQEVVELSNRVEKISDKYNLRKAWVR